MAKFNACEIQRILAICEIKYVRKLEKFWQTRRFIQHVKLKAFKVYI